MIIDSFMFFNEIDILMLRLHTLSEVVDHFIIVEAGETFSGKPKSFVFEENQKIFKHWSERISYVKLSGFPIGMTNPWAREAYQRNAILRGLPRDIDPDRDTLLISDADEIPHPVAIEMAARSTVDVAFQMTLYAYTPHWRHVKPWYGTRATTVQRAIERTPQAFRCTTAQMPHEITYSPAGWHFSYFGGVEKIQEKVGAYSHTEVDQPQYTNTEHIIASIQQGRSLVPGDGNEYEYVADPYVPKFMRQYPEVYGLDAEYAAKGPA